MEAIIAGSSGLVGTELLHQLCKHPSCTAVRLIVRKPSGFIHAKVTEYIVDFDHLDQFKDSIQGDVFFSCIGSTRKRTPDKKEYYRIDHDYPLHLAKIAQTNGVSQFHLVSSIGANPNAANFYLKMKGETEADISKVPFLSLHFYRPSILDGNRKDKRFLERIGLIVFKVINPLLVGKWRKYRSITAKNVARAMIAQALKEKKGLFAYESDQIMQIARSASGN